MKRLVFLSVASLVGICFMALACFGEETDQPGPRPPVKPGEGMVLPGKTVGSAKILDSKELLPFLPKAPEGWRAAKPLDSTQRMGPFGVSRVSQMFTKGKQRVEFLLEDLGTNNPYFFMKEPWKIVEKKTDLAYTKKLKVGDFVVEENFHKDRNEGLMFMVFEKRIQLNIKGSGIEDTSVIVEMAKGIDFNELKKTLEEKSK
jgi:hypothetical protein